MKKTNQVLEENNWSLADRMKIVSNAASPANEEHLFIGTDIPEEDQKTVLNVLLRNEVLQETADGICQASLKTFYEFIRDGSLNDSRKQLLLMRINGASLKEIAQKSNVSRENIRISEKIALTKAITGKPFSHGAQEPLYDKRIFKDHFYMDLLDNVKLEENFRAFLVKKDSAFYSAEYFYMRLYPEKRRNVEKKSLFRYLENHLDLVPKPVMNCIIEYYHPVFTDDGKIFKEYNGEFFLDVLKRYPRLKITELQKIYKEKKYVIEPFPVEREKKNARYFSYVFTLNRNVLRCDIGMIRYYDTNRYIRQVPGIIAHLKFPEKKGMVSANEVFALNKEILEEIDIHNGYELHALMRKTNQVPLGVWLGKMPVLYVET